MACQLGQHHRAPAWSGPARPHSTHPIQPRPHSTHHRTPLARANAESALSTPPASLESQGTTKLRPARKVAQAKPTARSPEPRDVGGASARPPGTGPAVTSQAPAAGEGRGSRHGAGRRSAKGRATVELVPAAAEGAARPRRPRTHARPALRHSASGGCENLPSAPAAGRSWN